MRHCALYDRIDPMTQSTDDVKGGFPTNSMKEPDGQRPYNLFRDMDAVDSCVA